MRRTKRTRSSVEPIVAIVKQAVRGIPLAELRRPLGTVSERSSTRRSNTATRKWTGAIASGQEQPAGEASRRVGVEPAARRAGKRSAKPSQCPACGGEMCERAVAGRSILFRRVEVESAKGKKFEFLNFSGNPENLGRNRRYERK